MKKPRLFVDMDGVLADFDRHYFDLFGHACADVPDDVMWLNIAKAKPFTFFQDLPWCQGAEKAWKKIQYLNPILLTACPASDYQNVSSQKKIWARNNLGPDVLVLPVVGGKNKVRFMQNKGDVLIDDFAKNIKPWVEEDGIGILHKSWDISLEVLEKIYNQDI